jgi:predicted permease
MPITSLDLKYAVRLLVKRPLFTLVTVLVLTGGLGISLYTFAALKTIVYRDLPVPDSGSIVTVGAAGAGPNIEPLETFELATVRNEAKNLGELGVFRRGRALVGERGSSRTLRSMESDSQVFEFTRTRPLLGRGFVPEDAVDGSEPVAVLSHSAWQTAFGGDAAVIGKLVPVNGRPTRVIGVMPERFAFPINTEIWLPLPASIVAPTSYSGIALEAYGRIPRGVAPSTAEAELTALVERVRQELPDDVREPAAVSVTSFQEGSFGVFGTVVFGVLNLLAISILLMAAVNVGNLLLARTNERIKEVGVRIALGAPRVRLIAEVMVENVLICAAGGALAVLLVARGLGATQGFMSALLGDMMPFWWSWGLDRDLAIAAVLFLTLTVLVVSVLPAFCVSSADPNSLLKDGTRAGGGLSPGRVSRALLTIQVALISAVILVGGAALSIAQRAANFDLGIDGTNVVMTMLEPPAERYRTAEQRASFYARFLAELRSGGGIDAAVFMDSAGFARFAVEGSSYASDNDRPRATLFVLSETPSPIGPTRLQGRGFDSRDSYTGAKTAIVSESFASANFPNESAVGRRIEVGLGDAAPEEREIVGVVSDLTLDPLGITGMGPEAIHVPIAQWNLPTAEIMVRHFGDQDQARSAIYEAVARVDSAAVPGQVQAYAEAQAQITLFATAIMKLFAGCAAFAIVLAITGIYAVSSNSVVLRSHEIGLRRALGASNRNVIGIFVVQGTRQLVIGLALSAVLSAAVLLAISQGFSVGAPTLTLLAAAVVVVVSATVLLSIYLAVRGIVRSEPSAILRS